MPLKGNGLVPVVDNLKAHRKYGYVIMLVLLCGLILSYWKLRYDVNHLTERLDRAEKAVPTQMNVVPTDAVECYDLDSYTPNPW